MSSYTRISATRPGEEMVCKAYLRGNAEFSLYLGVENNGWPGSEVVCFLTESQLFALREELDRVRNQQLEMEQGLGQPGIA